MLHDILVRALLKVEAKVNCFFDVTTVSGSCGMLQYELRILQGIYGEFKWSLQLVGVKA